MSVIALKLKYSEACESDCPQFWVCFFFIPLTALLCIQLVPCVYASTQINTFAVRTRLHIHLLPLSHTAPTHLCFYSLFRSYLNFHFSPIFSFCKTRQLIFGILSFCRFICPFPPPPFSSPSSRASACSCSIAWFSFMLSHYLSLSRSLSLSLSTHNTPNHPRDRACLLCLFHISALCSCDGNLSFKYLFLPSPLFFFSCFPHCCHHWCTPHTFPEILNCSSSNLAPGHFKTCHLQFRSTHWERVSERASEPGTRARQTIILLQRNSIKSACRVLVFWQPFRC